MKATWRALELVLSNSIESWIIAIYMYVRYPDSDSPISWIRLFVPQWNQSGNLYNLVTVHAHICSMLSSKGKSSDRGRRFLPLEGAMSPVWHYCRFWQWMGSSLSQANQYRDTTTIMTNIVTVNCDSDSSTIAQHFVENYYFQSKRVCYLLQHFH